jgi:regulator of sigma E protease
LDANVNPEHPKPPHHDMAEPGPIDPATGQPNRTVETAAAKSWLRTNASSLIITGVILWFVFYVLGLDPFDTFKVALGLGFIIFIHELGHFLAAKWCDVHVKTFSIGFGPAIPFCSYKWGETTYMLGVIPLGGYVSMVGEGTGESLPDADVDEEDSDPRSFKNKPVPHRMLIISAGVIMNLIFGLACFVAAYMHGVKEEPASVSVTSSGGAAWRAGIRDGDLITKIGSRENPTFKDLRPVVMSTDKGEKVPVTVLRDGKDIQFEVEPLREEGAYFPVLGVHADSQLVVFTPPKKQKPERKIVRDGSPAAEAGKFQPGDRIKAMTDPANPDQLSPLKTVNEYRQRLALLAGKTVTIGVQRSDEPEDAKLTEIKVEPAFRSKFGLRMQMGKIAALRAGGPAAEAGIQAVGQDDGPDGRGDRIAAVGLVDPSGKKFWYANDEHPPEAGSDPVRPLDPVLLPLQLFRWAASFPNAARKDLKVDLVVLRFGDQGQPQRKLVSVKYDDSYRFERETLPLPTSPLALDGLGLAYWVNNFVEAVEPGSPAEKAGIKPQQVVEAIQLETKPKEPNFFQRIFGLTNEKWDDVKPHHWGFVESVLQSHGSKEFKLRLKQRDETVEVSLAGVEDKEWPVEDRGLVLQPDSRIQKAADLGDATGLGVRRTVRFIREVYMNLYSMIRGRVSAKTLSGPLTIADVSYKIAGEDFWQFLIFLGVISVNLAVVNFLPVPVLDGGHFLFLVYEKITGRPLPERLFAALMYVGLAMILTLFIFVISRDILRLYF